MGCVGLTLRLGGVRLGGVRLGGAEFLTTLSENLFRTVFEMPPRETGAGVGTGVRCEEKARKGWAGVCGGEGGGAGGRGMGGQCGCVGRYS